MVCSQLGQNGCVGGGPEPRRPFRWQPPCHCESTSLVERVGLLQRGLQRGLILFFEHSADDGVPLGERSYDVVVGRGQATVFPVGDRHGLRVAEGDGVSFLEFHIPAAYTTVRG